MNDRDIIILKNPIREYLENHGVSVPAGSQVLVKCPFHDDKTPSMSVNTKDGIWNCFSCGIGGSVIDLEMRFTGCDIAAAMKELGGELEVDRTPKPFCPTPPPPLMEHVFNQ